MEWIVLVDFNKGGFHVNQAKFSEQPFRGHL